jgi:hypothetical protein
MLQAQRRENQKVRVSFKRFHSIFEVLYRLRGFKKKKKKKKRRKRFRPEDSF